MPLNLHPTDLVPFGKYKGQPVDTLLADGDYVRWVMAQPGIVQMLQQRHPTLLNVITIGAPQSEDTPEHNRLQARFLDREFQEAFFEAVTGKNLDLLAATQAAKDNKAALKLLEESIAKATAKADEARIRLVKWQKETPGEYDEWQRKEGERYRAAIAEAEGLSAYRHVPFPVIPAAIAVSFEHGYDVLLETRLTCSAYRYIYKYNFGNDGGMAWPPEIGKYETDSGLPKLQVEIKPQIGDDFPAVLRQIRRNRANVVLLSAFEASVTLDQVRQMFKGTARIVLVSEVDTIIARREDQSNAPAPEPGETSDAGAAAPGDGGAGPTDEAA